MVRRWASEELGRPSAASRAPAQYRAREGGRTDSGGEGKWTYRHRRELAPVWVIVLLVPGALLGHLIAPDLAWAPLVAGALVTAWGALWKADRTPERVYAAFAGGGAALWTSLGWAIGVDQLPVVVLGLLVAVPASGVWVAHQRPRGRIEVVGGSRLPWERERWAFERQAWADLERALARWETAGRDVAGSRVRSVVADFEAQTYTFAIEHAPGRIDADLSLGRVGSALGAPRDSVRIEDPDYGAGWHEVVVVWALDGFPSPGDEVPGVHLVENDQDEEPPARPVAVDQTALRLSALEEALRREGRPVSAKQAAKLAGLPHTWVWEVGLPTLRTQGRAIAVEKGWAVPA